MRYGRAVDLPSDLHLMNIVVSVCLRVSVAGLFPVSGEVVRVIRFFLSLCSDTPTYIHPRPFVSLLLTRRPNVCTHSSLAIDIPIHVVT